ncbi:MAG: hypothetical protein WCY11_14960 [Novosphingobium sp.]
MKDLTDELLAKSRAYGTTQERVVLALETIADQLRSLVAVMAADNESEGERDSPASRGTNAADDADEGAWENEGGSLDKGAAASLGIKHSMIDQFETGSYRYTNMADAIAEAKRARARSAS